MAELGADRVTGQELIREDINQRLSELVFQRTKRRPLIMPVVVEV
jgi:mRNA degradation ribonuclease J1/J2